jgi:rhodanese-related sulfurtransferase
MLSRLFGSTPKVDIPQLVAKGAAIVDVRTPAEYAGGHVKGSVNIPLDQLTQQLHKLRKDQPVITCCKSGMRSGSAAEILRDHGFEAHNGGSWMSVDQQLPKR